MECDGHLRELRICRDRDSPLIARLAKHRRLSDAGLIVEVVVSGTPPFAGFFMLAHRASVVLLQTREEPLVKVMGGHIHEWRKQTAVKGRRGAAL